MSAVRQSPQRAPSLERIDSQSTFTSFRDKMARALSPNGRSHDGASAPSIGARRPSLGSKSPIRSVSCSRTSERSQEACVNGDQGMPRRAKDKVQTLSVMDMIEPPQSVFRGSNWTRWMWARRGNRYLSERQRACLDT